MNIANDTRSSKNTLNKTLFSATSRTQFLRGLPVLALLGAAQYAEAAPQNPIVVGGARFSVLTPNCIRIEYAPDGHFVDAPSLFAVNRQTRFEAFKLEKSAKRTVIDTGAIRLSYSPNGQTFSAINLSATIKDGTNWTPGTKNRGNLGGTRVALDTIKGPVDVGQGVISRDGWYLLDDSTDPLLVNNWEQPRPKSAGQDWYLFGYGSDYHAALKSLTAIGGDVPLPRKNVFGSWYSRWWPYTSDEYRGIVQEYAQHDFPLDNIVFDMDWHHDGWTGWSWNRKLFPDAARLMSDLHAQGLQTTVNLHPGDGVAPHEDHYADFMKALGQPADGKTVRFAATDQKQMQALSSEILAPLYRDGVDFWWLDWTSPDLWWFNEVLTRDTALGGRRGQSFSRWAGWGDHRHPIHFSGDAESVWPMLAFEVPFTSTAGNVGCFFWSHDMGGFRGARNEELYTRWCQFGTFSAALRSHSNRDSTIDRRPWTYPDWAEKSMRLSFHLRSELFPYIYGSVAQSCRDSVPLVRAMYFEYPEEEAAYHNGQEYLYGDNFLVAPIASPGVGPNRVAHQAVWFPPGNDWFNTFSGEKFAGGTQALVAADINEMPIFARGGALIPMQPYNARMTTAPLTTLRVRAFPGADGGTGRSSLYEDDGSSNAYKSGASAQTPLRYMRRGNRIEITVGATTGKFNGQLVQRAVQIELPATNRATSATLEGKSLPISYDETTATNTIKVPTRPTTKGFTVAIEVADADFAALRNKALARRMNGVTGHDFAPQNPHDLIQSALALPLSTPETDEALAVVGVGIVAKNQSPIYTRDEVRDVFFSPPGVMDDEAQVENVSRAKATFKIGGKVVHMPDALGAEDIAPYATVTVSGTENGYNIKGATDKVLSGYPDDKTAEWSSGQKAGATLRLTWNTPQKIDRIALYDRPNTVDNVTRSLLTFSDGTTIEVGPLPDDGELPSEVRFPAKTIQWVEWKALGVGDTTANAGLSEIAAFRTH
ncbi:oligosaccharide 4-alpha-D-glucosyltransferase [Abditibacteriota bacterium]|nr:oligosaccharide 4-alpha-D-glucosyltransferase [Abditibacteriota bacterium]